MNPYVVAFSVISPLAFLGGFLLHAILQRDQTMAITADFQAQIDRLNASAAAAAAGEQTKIDAAVKAATDTLTQDAADNLAGVTSAADAVAAAVGA